MKKLLLPLLCVSLIGMMFYLGSCEMTNHSHQKLKKSSTPNFIFILADDQGWNGTSVKMMHDEPGSKSDYFETPNLVKFADSGMRFSNAYSSFQYVPLKVQYSIW